MARIVKPTPQRIAEAAEILRGGGLVAFPTETVYGLGANALDAAAVARIFEAKLRPATNPLIVHVASLEEAATVAVFPQGGAENHDEPGAVDLLTARFWPGPLTLVMRKRPVVPDIVTAGGETVGVRMPDHPVAWALISACGFPLAAPSANRSEQVSPTLAEHVAESLGDAVDLILDGGPCEVGLESTVLDLTTRPPRILRPGMVTAAQIEMALGTVHGTTAPHATGPARSPGQRRRHYAPRTPIVLVDTEDLPYVVAESAPATPVLGTMDSQCVMSLDSGSRQVEILAADPEGYAAGLYAALRRLDAAAMRAGASHILVQRPPDGPDWDAIRDRLTRASAAPDVLPICRS